MTGILGGSEGTKQGLSVFRQSRPELCGSTRGLGKRLVGSQCTSMLATSALETGAPDATWPPVAFNLSGRLGD